MAHRPRRWQLVGLLLLGVTLAGTFLYRFFDHTGINEANFEKIQVGMSLQEVESLLGGPANHTNSGLIRIWYGPHRVKTNADEDNPLAFLLPGEQEHTMVVAVLFDVGEGGGLGPVRRKRIDVDRIPRLEGAP